MPRRCIDCRTSPSRLLGSVETSTGGLRSLAGRGMRPEASEDEILCGEKSQRTIGFGQGLPKNASGIRWIRLRLRHSPGDRAFGWRSRNLAESVPTPRGSGRCPPEGRLEGGISHARLWANTFVEDANLPNLVAELRAQLGDEAKSPQIIRTVQRFGYAFVGAEEPLPDPARAAEAAPDDRGAAIDAGPVRSPEGPFWREEIPAVGRPRHGRLPGDCPKSPSRVAVARRFRRHLEGLVVRSKARDWVLVAGFENRDQAVAARRNARVRARARAQQLQLRQRRASGTRRRRSAPDAQTARYLGGRGDRARDLPSGRRYSRAHHRRIRAVRGRGTFRASALLDPSQGGFHQRASPRGGGE